MRLLILTVLCQLAPWTAMVLAAPSFGRTLSPSDYFSSKQQVLPDSHVAADRDASKLSTIQLTGELSSNELPNSESIVPAQYGQAIMGAAPSGSPAGSSYSTADVYPGCTSCPNRGYYGFFGYDSFRGIPDSGWCNNGLHGGLNFGTRLGPISDWTGIGFQLGASVNVYNFNGTDYHLSRNDQATMQGFVTSGFFHKANEQSNWNAGIANDWMLTSNYGIFAQNPTLAQWRGQLGYVIGPLNEIGLWGTWVGQGDSRNVQFFGPTTWRPVQQISVYWHYKWGVGGADSWISFGVPEHDRLTGNGSLGDYVVSAITYCPLSDTVMLYAQVTYMHPSSSPGPTGGQEDSWAFLIGLSFFPGRNARTATVAGQCWMPLLPVANNGTFLVDTSRLY